MKIFISVVMIKDIGGISTSILNLLSKISPENDITLCVFADYISPDIKLPENIKLIKGSEFLRDCYSDRNMLKSQTMTQMATRNIRRFIRRARGTEAVVNREIKKIKVPGEYDVAICYSNDIYDKEGKLAAGGVNAFIAEQVKAKCRVSWVHNDARNIGFTKELCIKMFENYDAIVNVSNDCKKVFDEIIPKYADKSFVVYNMYDIDNIKKQAEAYIPYEDNGKIRFVTVARLYNHQKRIDRIIEVVSRLKEEGYENFDWTIVGEGGDRPAIEAMIEEKGVAHLVHLTGLKQNPYPYMKGADAFVLTSAYEGYGMTIKEAQILGTPALVTEFGPAHEAVTEGIDGMICNNSTDGVYGLIKKVLDNRSILEELNAKLEENPVTNEKAIKQFYEVCNK